MILVTTLHRWGVRDLEQKGKRPRRVGIKKEF